MSHEPLVFNGINGSTGEYLLASLTRAELAQAVVGKEIAGNEHRDRVLTRRPAPGVDPKELATSGWGVVFAHDADPRVREALGELLEHRRAQAAKTHEHYYQEYDGDQGLRPGESMRAWLARHGAGPGPVYPAQVPYYLLLVGDPEMIPLDFQFQLSTQYAVGRIHFDTWEEYSRYAHNVVEAERSPEARPEIPVSVNGVGAALRGRPLRTATGNAPTTAVPPAPSHGTVGVGRQDFGEREGFPAGLPEGRPRQAVLFGVDNPDDRATYFTTKYLMKPLLEKMENARSGWEVQAVLGEEATKARLSHLLGGDETPALLLTASHGMGFNQDDPRFPGGLGALLCQDWPGPKKWRQPIPEDYYFSAEDVSKDADLRGLVSFHFACFSAGMPRQDSFAHESGGEPRMLGSTAVLAPLPQRLLSHPGGGALAVIGHIDRARGFSFIWPGAGSQPQTFAAVLQDLMEGYPVGRAASYLGERYAEIGVSFNVELLKARRGEGVDEIALADLWTAYVDARSYVILGDPAVRLKLDE